MLRHLGRRTYIHNLRLESLLGLTAGAVNAEGFLGYKVLTTNVTGHVAFFAESLTFEDWDLARVIFFYMLLFFLGAFTSSFIMSWLDSKRRFFSYLPILMEIYIILLSALNGNGNNLNPLSRETFAGSLLFAMGIQNALVTVISGSIVRTTHLTGTITDLGIDLSQWIRKIQTHKSNLILKIKLKVYLIFFFIVGAIVGGYLFRKFHFYGFYFPILVLLFTLFFDYTRIVLRMGLKRFRIKEI